MSTTHKPKYMAVYDDIYRKIESGHWRGGDRLPAEMELAEHYQVSLGTVQKSLRMLEQSGLVVRRHGSGTYVRAVITAPHEISQFLFMRSDGTGPLPLHTRVTSLGLTKTTGPWFDFLGTTEVIRIRRNISVNLEFGLFAEMYVRQDQCGGLLDMPKESLDGFALYRTIFSTYHLPPTRFTYQMCLGTTPAVAQTILQVEAGSACIHWEIFAHTYRDAPLFYQRVYLPPSHRKLRFEVPLQPRDERTSYAVRNGKPVIEPAR